MESGPGEITGVTVELTEILNDQRKEILSLHLKTAQFVEQRIMLIDFLEDLRQKGIITKDAYSKIYHHIQLTRYGKI